MAPAYLPLFCYCHCRCAYVHAKSLQSCLTLCDHMDCSPPGSSVMGFSRQEYWSGLLCIPPGDLPNPRMEPMSLASPALAGGFFTTWAIREAHIYVYFPIKIKYLYICIFILGFYNLNTKILSVILIKIMMVWSFPEWDSLLIILPGAQQLLSYIKSFHVS